MSVQDSEPLHILAIDTGSSSVRGLACDSDGTPLPGVFVKFPYQFERSGDGGTTVDADALCDRIFACIDATLAEAPSRAFGTVAMDTFASSLLGLDDGGRPATPLYTWSDARGGEVVPALKTALRAGEYAQRTGCAVHPSYWPVRLAWLRQTDPDAFGQVRRWTTLGSYLLWRLFGVHRVGISEASWTGMLDRRTMDWDAPALAAVGIARDQLDDVSADALTGPGAEWNARWPQLRGTRWLPSIGDGAASNLGMGCTTPDRVALALGTSGAMRIVVPGTPAHVPDGLFCYRLDDGRSLVGGALSNVGNYYRWMRAVLRVDPQRLDERVAAMQPDGHGLTVLPFLAGERTPYWETDLPTGIVGLRPATTPMDVLRAGLEATAFGFWRVWERLGPLTTPGARIVAGGGATGNSPALMQILADTLGETIHAAEERETTSRGTALFAAGREADEIATRAYQPNMAAHAVYRAAVARQERLLDDLRAV